ncbi:hypothetical protein CDO87_07710 [Sagittula sp. P11]|uniref:hypothetical protein n=1 Tax=Sagittula sp. P11 TaxID=2009329 RepID=UPI000C2D2E37|nr:hypothetical protein [Sagittula sp. P11]AUC53089.1 hypothetical protein CDO87_07710 [Sagittula sp. P11]
MTENDKLKALKLLAKRYARATGQPQHAALDVIAARLGFSHWNALTGSAKGEWDPSEAQVAAIKAFVQRITSHEGTTFDHIFGGPDAITRGEIQGHPYELCTMLGDVRMEGDSWRILLPENPSATPRVEVDIEHAQNSPMNDRELLAEAMTCHGIFPPPSIRVRPNLRTDNEANEIHGRADHRHPGRA